MRLNRRQLLIASGSVAVLGGSGALTPNDIRAQTPIPSSEQSPNAPLLELANCFPLSLLSDNVSEGRELLTFGDFAYRLESVGVDLASILDPQERFRAFATSTFPVSPSDLLLAATRTEDPVALLGWNIEDISQCAYVMSSEGILTTMRGAFQRTALETAWNTNGYQPRTTENIGVFSVSEDRMLDPSTELGRVTLGNAGNVALLDDGLLLYAPTLASLTAMIQAHNGTVNSLGADPLVQSVVAGVAERMSGAILLPAGAFAATIPLVLTDDDDLEFAEPPEPGPIPLMGLIGFVSGNAVPDNDIVSNVEPAPSGSQLVSSRRFLTEVEAQLAARRSLITLESQSSFMTGQPWAEIFAGWQITVDADEKRVSTEIDLYANEGIWAQIVYARDAWFLYG